MIVLDTNVVSELIRPSPAAAVQRWVDVNPGDEIHVTAITLAEVRYGIQRLPDGRRNGLLRVAAEEILATFEDRILVFDDVAATWYASTVVTREAAGRPIEPFDALIAAICGAHRAALATRNTKDFEGLGLDLVDPWDTP